MKCPKCEGEMEKGVTVDAMPGGGIKAHWAKNISWGGLKAEDRKEIETYRCKKCGYLESYAK